MTTYHFVLRVGVEEFERMRDQYDFRFKRADFGLLTDLRGLLLDCHINPSGGEVQYRLTTRTQADLQAVKNLLVWHGKGVFTVALERMVCDALLAGTLGGGGETTKERNDDD